MSDELFPPQPVAAEPLLCVVFGCPNARDYGSWCIEHRPLDDERAHARRTDPDTSHAAARSVVELRPRQQAVLDVLRSYGRALTDEEIAERYDGPQQSPSGLRTRRSELVSKGFARDSGERRPLASGRLAIAWEAV